MSEEVTRGRILARLVLMLSAALFFFYFNVTCQKISRAEFERAHFEYMGSTIRSEFPPLGKSSLGM